MIAAYYGLLLAAKAFRPTRPVLAEMHPEYWLGGVRANTPIGRFLCRGGTTDFDIMNPHYESTLVAEIGTRLSAVSDQPLVFIDVGAHIGKYTIHAGRSLGDRGIVLAVEPDPENFAALRTNVSLNRLENVRAYNLGCWDSEATLKLHRKRGNLGGHSFVEPVGEETVEVPVRPLDSLAREAGISGATILKIDVERAEEHVLRGAERVLRSSPPPTVYFEEHRNPESAGSVRYLRDLGFTVEALEGITYIATRR